MQPEPIEPFVPAPVAGSWLTRSARAIFVERRLPGAVRARLDRMLLSFGWRTRTVDVGEHRVTFRRCTADEAFIDNVLVRKEYFRAGYAPRPGGTVVDIGANIGTFVLATKAVAPDVRVVAVEPFPENVALLRRNVAQNDLKDVDVVPAAIGTSNGRITLFVGVDTGMHSVVFDRGLGSVEVVTSSLETLFEQCGVETCDLLKIDCEGAEFDFLPKITPALWARVRRVAMEFSVPVHDWTFDHPTAEQIVEKRRYSDSLVALLQANGFHVDVYQDCLGFRAGYIFARNTSFAETSASTVA